MKVMPGFYATVLCAGFACAVHAAPIVDEYAPDEALSLSTGVAYTYTHNLLAYLDPPTDALTNASLSFFFGSQAQGNSILIVVDGFETPLYSGQLNGLPGSFVLGSHYIDALSDTGILAVTLTKGGGAGSTFSFTGATLTAELQTRNAVSPVPVPEPGTLALIGLGLLGGVFARRRSA